MAFMDSTAMVNRARSTVARADPATSIEHIMRTVMQRGGHEAPGAHASAALANAVVRKGSKYVIEPLDIKIRVVAELAVHCAIDAMAFIEALQFAHGASFEGAEKHLRGLGSAYMALEALVQVAPPGRFAERLFAQKDLTPQKITAILKEEPMLLFLLALAERERPTARNGGPVVWDAPRTINAIIYLCAAAIVDKSPRDGVLASLAWVHSISGSLFGDTSERSITPVLRILNTDPRILTDLVKRGLGEIEFMTRAACGQGDVDQARDIIEGATALWFALHESSVGVAVGGPTRLHDVLRSAGLHDAMQLADKVHWGDALGYARWAFGDPDRVQHAIGRFVYMINDPNMSAESPALWDEVIRRCEEAGFTCARSTVSALRDAAVIAADSALVAHAHAICNAASTRASISRRT